MLTPPRRGLAAWLRERLPLVAFALLGCSAFEPEVGSSTASSTEGLVNGCHPNATPNDFVTGDAISFTYPAFTPPCLQVSPGSTVTFTGTAAGGGFETHPLTPGIPPNLSTPSIPVATSSPIMAQSTGMSASFTFATAGIYPYYCARHDIVGMYGVILVR
jgi:plastocyanin